VIKRLLLFIAGMLLCMGIAWALDGDNAVLINELTSRVWGDYER